LILSAQEQPPFQAAAYYLWRNSIIRNFAFIIGNLRVSPLKILTKGSAFGNRKGSALDPQAFEKA